MSPAEYQEPFLSDNSQTHYNLSDKMKHLQQELLYQQRHSQSLEKRNLCLRRNARCFGKSINC